MDKYRKTKIVGKGNFGYAVLVQNIQNKKFYIMKVIDVSKMDSKQKTEALNEVHVLKEMRHPYIIAYRESFMNKKCLCIVMDYADGGDLYTKIAQHKKDDILFSEEQIIDWFVKICLAIKHVHDKRILHRDLKTQNIFLTSSGDVKIGDFGIARVLQSTYDCAQTAIGTPYYLSPEICQEKPYNQKSDIWSLGCILYEMVTLKHAFDANNIKGLVLKILKGSYPAIPFQYSDKIKSLVAELLIKDPKKRPSIRKILEKDFMKVRIQKIFDEATLKQAQEDRVRKISEVRLHEDKSMKQISMHCNEKVNKENMPSKTRDHTPSKCIIKQSLVKPTDSVSKYSVQEEEKSAAKASFCCNDENVGFISSLHKMLNNKSVIDEEETFPEEERARPFFLTPEGKAIPGLTGQDTMSYRIEALRAYLDTQFGEKLLIKVYNLLQDEVGNEECTEEAQRILGNKKQYIGLVIQLIVCEDNYYKQ